jgi:HPt (histidine-containing phosphotransfer) domain-containing protein
MQRHDHLSYLKKTLSHNEFNVLVSVYINEIQDCQNSVLYSLEKKDPTSLFKTCHKIYSDAITFSNDDLAKSAQEIVKSLEFDEEIDEASVQTLLDAIKNSISIIEKAKIMSNKDE